MNLNWRLLACFFSLPALTMIAAPVASPISAPKEFVENKEVAQSNKKGTCEVKKSAQCKNQKNCPAQPEEKAIQSQPTITPSVAPYIVDGTDTFLTVDFIWWKSVISGSDFAFSGVVDNGNNVKPFGSSTSQGSVLTPAFAFEPGFKVGIGVNFEHDGWDLYANYTFLAGVNTTNNVNASTGVGAATTMTLALNNGSSILTNVNSASCKYEQDFNTVDLELGRNFFVSRYLTLRPHAGLKTGWILETATFNLVPTQLTDIPVAPTTGFAGNTVQGVVLTRSQHIWGLGVRTGMNGGWHITKHWSFYSDFALTSLWADFHIKAKEQLQDSVSGSNTAVLRRQTITPVIPVIETGLGLTYITWWDQNHYRFQIQAGWEQQIWLDFNRFLDFNKTGTLSLQGLTTKLMLTF